MQPTEVDERHAEEWAQSVVDAWGKHVQAGNAAVLTDEFKDLVNKACSYRNAKSLADNRREPGTLSEQEAGEEKRTRRAFVEAYMCSHRKHGQML